MIAELMMSEVAPDRESNDHGFYRTVCLETIKDLLADKRHAESQSLTVFAQGLVIASGLASVFSFFAAHRDQHGFAQAVWFIIALVVVAFCTGAFCLLTVSPLRRRAIKDDDSIQSHIQFLTARGDLPVDMPPVSTCTNRSVPIWRRKSRDALYIFEPLIAFSILEVVASIFVTLFFFKAWGLL